MEEFRMAVRKAQALWEGSLREGHGLMKFGSFEGPFSFTSRFEDGNGTNPEELIGAAHAGCFSMALSAGLGRAGFTPQFIQTNAHVTLDKVNGKSRITQIHLDCEASVPGIDAESFAQIAEETKSGCPVSAALTGVQINLDAKLV
jgi:osmotically inducible protein OsmC